MRSNKRYLAKVYICLYQYIRKHGTAPRQRDIIAAVGGSQSRVSYAIADLERLGWIRRVPGSREVEIEEK